jgi:hypothetical protein
MLRPTSTRGMNDRTHRGRAAVRRVGLSALCVVVGLAGWWFVWSMVTSSWDQPVRGLTYEEWNRLMPLPLVLLLAGVLGLSAVSGGWRRVGLALAALGLVVAIGGSALEFWVAGGIRTGQGDWSLSVLGWTLFLLGHLLALLGAATAAAAVLLMALVRRARA